MIIHDVQQRSEAWYKLRSGMPTASEFKGVITSAGKPSKSITPYAHRLAAEVMAGDGVDAWGGNADTTRGSWLEDDAADYYSFVRCVPVEACGFITDDEQTMGCSPDMLVGDDGMLEIKCLKAEKHVAAILHCVANGAPPSDYIQQVQGQMMISGRKWCDMIFYHANLDPYIIRVLPDPEMHEALLAGIKTLIETRDNAVNILRTL